MLPYFDFQFHCGSELVNLRSVARNYQNGRADVWGVGEITPGEILWTVMDGDRLLHGKSARSLRGRALHHHVGHSPPGITTLLREEVHHPDRFTGSSATHRPDAPGPGQDKVIKIIGLANTLYKQGNILTIEWVPGHKGSVANKEADAYTRGAARQRIPDKDSRMFLLVCNHILSCCLSGSGGCFMYISFPGARLS